MLRLLLALAVTVILGLASRLYPADWGFWDRDLGKILYAVAAYLALAVVLFRKPPKFVAAIALSCCLAVELFKLTGIPAEFQEVPLVSWFLGTTFSVMNLGYYLLGVVLIALCHGETRGLVRGEKRGWAIIRRILLLLVVSAPFAAGGVAMYRHSMIARQHRTFSRRFEEVHDRIVSLQQGRPANVSPEHWDEAVGWAGTAFYNLWPCAKNTHADLEVFSARLEERIAAGDNLATLRWLWNELRHKSEYGATYAAHCMPVRAMTADPITDGSLKGMWGIGICLTLDLSNTAITDSGLEHLKGSNQLIVLLLNGTKVTDEGVKRLQKALPICEVYR